MAVITLVAHRAARGTIRLMASQSATIADPLVALLTVEGALVTVLGGVLAAVPGLTDADRVTLAAMQCEDEAHWHLLAALGAQMPFDVFTLPEPMAADRGSALLGMSVLKEIALGAQMAYNRTLVQGADPRLAETLFAMGAIEGGHHAALRAALGEAPVVARAFLPWRFSDAAQAIDALTAIGVVGGVGTELRYPGPLARVCRGVSGLVPETTEDAAAWGG